MSLNKSLVLFALVLVAFVVNAASLAEDDRAEDLEDSKLIRLNAWPYEYLKKIFVRFFTDRDL